MELMPARDPWLVVPSLVYVRVFSQVFSNLRHIPLMLISKCRTFAPGPMRSAMKSGTVGPRGKVV